MQIDSEIPLTTIDLATTPQCIELDPNRIYTFVHTGKNAANSADTTLIVVHGPGGSVNLNSGQGLVISNCSAISVSSAGAPTINVTNADAHLSVLQFTGNKFLRLPNTDGVLVVLQDIIDQINSLVPAMSEPISLSILSKTADYTAIITDANSLVQMNKATAVAFKIPTNASVAFPIGTKIRVAKVGIGATTISAVNSGTTTIVSKGNTPAAPVVSPQYGVAECVKVATDTWLVSGDVV